MGFPATIYVALKGGGYLTVKNALLQTEEVVVNFDQTIFRDAPPVLPAVGVSLKDSGLGSGQVAGVGSGITVTPAGGDASVGATSSVLQDDNYRHVAPRPQQARRTRIRWWDKANPGVAQLITGNITTNSNIIVVGSIAGLFVGQGVTGTGIPANAFIQQLILGMEDPPTINNVPRIILSQAANATTVGLDLTIAAGADGAANPVGECWLDRYLGWSEEPPQRY